MTGDQRTGDQRTGDRKTGDRKTGDRKTGERWRQHDPVDGDVDWRGVRAEGRVVAGLVKLGRSTLVYTYDVRLSDLDGARFDSPEAARAAVAAALATPSTAPALLAGPARARPMAHTKRRRPAAASHFHDG